jgi:hypothetical protein
MTSPALRYHIIDQHTIFDTFCSKLTSHWISHFRLRLRCQIALINPFILVQDILIIIFLILNKSRNTGSKCKTVNVTSLPTASKCFILTNYRCFLIWRDNDVTGATLPYHRSTYYRWYNLLEIDLSLNLTSQASPSMPNWSDKYVLAKLL